MYEQLLNSLPQDVKHFCCSKEAETAEQVAKFADLYFEISKIGKDPNFCNPSTCQNAPTNQTFPRGPKPPTQGREQSQRFGESRQQQFARNQNMFPRRGEQSFNANEARQRNRPVYDRQHNNALFVNDNECFVDELMTGDYDECTAFLCTDKDFVVPLYVNDVETEGLRDSGCDVAFLISQDLIKTENIDYNNSMTLKGAFDKNKVHHVPTTTIKVRSPRFLYDQNIEVTAGVLILPLGIKCLIGNSLFKNHNGLTDVITLRCDQTDAGERSIVE